VSDREPDQLPDGSVGRYVRERWAAAGRPPSGRSRRTTPLTPSPRARPDIETRPVEDDAPAAAAPAEDGPAAEHPPVSGHAASQVTEQERTNGSHAQVPPPVDPARRPELGFRRDSEAWGVVPDTGDWGAALLDEDLEDDLADVPAPDDTRTPPEGTEQQGQHRPATDEHTGPQVATSSGRHSGVGYSHVPAAHSPAPQAPPPHAPAAEAAATQEWRPRPQRRPEPPRAEPAYREEPAEQPETPSSAWPGIPARLDLPAQTAEASVDTGAHAAPSPAPARDPAARPADGTHVGARPAEPGEQSRATRGVGRWTDPGAVAAQEAHRARTAEAALTDDAALSSARLLRPSKRPPQSGWRKLLYLLTGRMLNPGESPADVRKRELTARVNQPLLGCHKIATLSLKGGVGKTTITATLGATFASLRGDRVVAVDANPDRGTLSQKIPLETSATVRHLLRDAQRVRRYTDVRAYTSQGASRLEVLASEQDPAVSEAYSERDYRRTVTLLEHFYNIVLTDCGTGLMHSAMYGVLGVADQLIIVSSGSIDGARSASATMDWLDAHGHQDLVRNAVAVINCVHRSAGGVDLQRVAEHFSGRCRAVVQIPFDAHLEEGAEVDLERLDQATQIALLELAASVADGFPS
jgi:MinD-like ATPase involved in chromosome partitioning or flagellar assembly